ncbi:hypothetical protein BpHYR1_014694 [Brachionus plicatilis]|uniref:Uncharacterized protein n=1 Tax=Brachionus plicatilis TaxID=10195 RepID=A0A3M7RHK9_BRAPC|nr:hypothetical protein BpHYR1_014694 [Brachionus plicatilis]
MVFICLIIRIFVNWTLIYLEGIFIHELVCHKRSYLRILIDYQSKQINKLRKNFFKQNYLIVNKENFLKKLKILDANIQFTTLKIIYRNTWTTKCPINFLWFLLYDNNSRIIKSFILNLSINITFKD